MRFIEAAARLPGVPGVDRPLAQYGEHVAAIDLLPVGARRRDWRATLISDGMVIVRHPELAATVEIADAFATGLQLYAG